VTLPLPDIEYLKRRNLQHQLVAEGGMTCVVLPSWRLPVGLSQSTADLLLRLQPGYPDLPPDMWWFSPDVLLANGSRIQATEVTEHHLGRPWQRWSRHLQPGQWKSGVDGLESYLALIDRELARAAQSAA
jgi:hypothetical protein